MPYSFTEPYQWDMRTQNPKRPDWFKSWPGDARMAVQVIVSLRLLFHAGLIQKALIVCPKPLVINWSRVSSRLEVSWLLSLPFAIC